MILWTIRASALLYALALVEIIRHREARSLWTAACAFYLAHVFAAFNGPYDWSHTIAVRETARQTRELFGLDWGGGIWFNYVFTGIWTADVLWWRLAPASRERRPAVVGNSIHAFMAWMFVNGTVIFPQGTTRWVAGAATAALFVFWLRRRPVYDGGQK